MSGGRTTALGLILAIVVMRLAFSGRLRASYAALLGPMQGLGSPLAPGPVSEPNPLPPGLPITPIQQEAPAKGISEGLQSAGILDVVLGLFEG